MSPVDPAVWMTTGQVARFLEVSTSRVIHLADAGRLPYARTQHGRLFDPEGVKRYAETRRVLHRDGEAPQPAGEELNRKSRRR